MPELTDILTINKILEEVGVEVTKENDTITYNASNITKHIAPYDLVRKMRGSFLLLGPLLTRFGHAEISMPGGCAIGNRPIDIHLRGLAKMGADIQIEKGYVKAKGKLKGAKLDLEFPLSQVLKI